MVSIRLATTEDAHDIDAMVRELATHENTLDDVHATAESWKAVLARPDVTVFIARAGGDAVGFVSTLRRLHLWSGGDLLALDDLYVRPGYRDKGIGTLLMNTVAAFASREDLIVIWGARLDNHAGHRFYLRLGATLSTKTTAAWTPEAYNRHLAQGVAVQVVDTHA